MSDTITLPRKPTTTMLEAMGAMDGYEVREKEVFPYQRYQDYFDALIAAAEGRFVNGDFIDPMSQSVKLNNGSEIEFVDMGEGPLKSMSNTPRTHAAIVWVGQDYPEAYVPVEFAEQLERERADLLAALEDLYECVSLYARIPDEKYNHVTNAAVAIAKARGEV